MAGARSGADEVRRAIFELIRDGFDFTAIPGLTSNPTITQNPTRLTQEPYIYVYSAGEFEGDVDKRRTRFEYLVNVEVCLRYKSYGGGQRQGDRIIDEVKRLTRLKTGFPDISNRGWRIYRMVSGETLRPTPFKERGANYYKVIAPLTIAASFIGLPTSVRPIGVNNFTYSGFAFPPINNRLEFGDAGTITGATTHVDSNGWRNNGITYAQVAGGDGALANNIYTVETLDSTLGLTGNYSWVFTSNSELDTTTQDVTNFQRIKSLRYGSINQSSISESELLDFTLFQGTNKTFDHGNTNPVGSSITLNGNSGERFYIITDEDIDIFQLNDQFGNNISDYDLTTTSNGYKIYLQTRDLSYDNFSQTFEIR